MRVGRVNESSEMTTGCDTWPLHEVPLRQCTNVKTTQTYFRVDGSIFGMAVDAGKAERSTGRYGGQMGRDVGAPVGREHGGVAMAVTGALAGRVALTGCWGLLAAVSLATVSW